MSNSFRPKTIDKTETTSNTYWSRQYQLEVVTIINPAWGKYPQITEFNVKNIESGCEKYINGLCMELTVRNFLDGQHCNHCICNECFEAMDKLPRNNTEVELHLDEVDQPCPPVQHIHPV
mgnify:CR=1 FL=1